MNKVILTGNLTRDIELRYAPSGKAVCDITIANNDQKDKTAFILGVAWDKTAEFLSQYFKKGQAILIEGSLTQDEWEDKDTGKKRTRTKVNVFKVEFQGKKEVSQTNNTGHQQQPYAPVQQPVRNTDYNNLREAEQQNYQTNVQQPNCAPQQNGGEDGIPF